MKFRLTQGDSDVLKAIMLNPGKYKTGYNISPNRHYGKNIRELLNGKLIKYNEDGYLIPNDDTFKKFMGEEIIKQGNIDCQATDKDIKATPNTIIISKKTSKYLAEDLINTEKNIKKLKRRLGKV